MQIPEVDQALSECNTHLDQDDGKYRGTQIERYLIEYLLILICGSLEDAIRRTLIEGVRKSRNKEFESFVQTSVDEYFKMNFDTTKRYVKAFGTSIANAFDGYLRTDPQIVSHYKSLVANRHDVAHRRKTITLSINDIEQYYKKAHLVVDAVKAAFV